MEQDYEMPSTGIDLGCKKLPIVKNNFNLNCSCFTTDGPSL